jgi:beta-lactam-binding protein with PASTA domain
VWLDKPDVILRAGDTATFHVRVRKPECVVEGCAVTVRGVPAGWVRIEPATFSTEVDRETDVIVEITPPVSAETPTGRLALEIVVRSDVNASFEQRCDATLVIEPAIGLTVAVEPAVIRARRAGRAHVTVENFGATTRRLTFSADSAKRLRLTFDPDQVEVQPGHRVSAVVDVRARRLVWGGVERLLPFTVGVSSDDGSPLEPSTGCFRQPALSPRWVLPVAAAVVVVAITASLVLFRGTLNNSTAAGVSVPNVSGLTIDAAKAALQQRSLVATVVDIFGDGNPGQVVAQDPKSGTRVDKGSTVTLRVDTDRTVPNVVFQPWVLAERELAAAGFTMVVDGSQPSDDDDQAMVLSQTPEAGQPSVDGQVHVRIYSRGTQFTLTDLRGLDITSVQTSLANTGILVTTRQEENASPRGTIIDQSPPAGSVVTKGNTVTLVVSTGHPPTADTSGNTTTPT